MYLALRDIRHAKGRFVLMGAVVGLIAFLLVMLSGLTAGLAHQSVSGITGLNATTIAFGAAEGDDPQASYTESQVTAEQVEAWRAAPGVRRAEALGIVQTRLRAGGSANVAVFAAEPGGALAPGGTSEGSVVLSASVAEEQGVDVGDVVELGGTGVTVAGTIEDQWYSHTPVVWVSLKDWRQLAHAEGTDAAGTAIAATYDAAAPGAWSPAEIDARAGTVSQTRDASRAAIGAFSSENGSLMTMQGFLYGISALVIAAFLTVWTVQRTRDIAVLKALGASNRYVLRDALTQAAIVLVAGSAAGGALGLGAGLVAARAVPFLTSPATTGLPVAGIVLLGLAGSFLAVRRVVRVDPLLALGGN